MRCGIRLLLLWTCLLLVPAPALAAPPVPPSHRYGLLQLAEPSPLALREAHLTVSVQENVSRAEVEGVYQVENPTGQAVRAELVWTYVDLYSEEPQPPVITADGVAVQPQIQTDADLYRHLLDAMVRFVPGEASRKEIRQLADRLLPTEAERLRQSWRPWVVDWSSGIYWVRFPVAVPAGGVTAIRIRYEQAAPSWEYPVLLSQRSGWSKVGPVSALVHTPAGYRVQANVPVVRTGHQDSLDLAALPDELVIRVTKWPLPRSLSGAWRWYGALLVAGGLAFSATIMARRRGVRR